MNRVLVTGAAGRIGQVVTAHLIEQGVAVTGLILEEVEDLPADRVVVGNASDPAVADQALADVDAVIHLAALPTPRLGTPQEVFIGNTAATFTILEEAGRRGIRHAAIASSINAIGIGYSPRSDAAPGYFPLDDHSPTRAADPYSMSKWVDEFVAESMVRRYDMTIACLRFPLVGLIDDDGRFGIRRHLDALVADPGPGASDFWLYLDTRDAAAAAWGALHLDGPPQAVVAFVAAPTISVPYRTQQLLDRFWPGVEQRAPLNDDQAPVDLSTATTRFGFVAEHVRTHQLRDLPG